jgi:hypothetical protein
MSVSGMCIYFGKIQAQLIALLFYLVFSRAGFIRWDHRTYLKNKIRVQEQQVELCEIPRIGNVKW